MISRVDTSANKLTTPSTDGLSILTSKTRPSSASNNTMGSFKTYASIPVSIYNTLH